ncbi:hypothetical protein DH2020_049655 [Rehmannia glutinosa]|uniref:PB1 domain-containing protein n=1 Tax=Rehmannia glutinosa TaxID=99300 RepID=A0ABR0U2I1_REHGL
MVGSSVNSHNLTLKPIKFLCSYGGRILPRYPDGKLRYHGGETRVLSVERSISFAELLVKLREMCGTSVSLRCQLPTEDLDALVSITSDEDLANLIEEYDRAAAAVAPPSSVKIRAFLSAPKTTRKSSSPTSSVSPAVTAPHRLNHRSIPSAGGGVAYHLDARRRLPAGAFGILQGRRCTLLSVRKPPEKFLLNTRISVSIIIIAMEMVALFMSSTMATTGNSRKKILVEKELFYFPGSASKNWRRILRFLFY